MDILFLEILELTHSVRYAPLPEKMPYLEKAISKIDKIKFFAEVSWENKLLSTKEYSGFLDKIQEIGRELGGWKKGMLHKNSRS